MESKSKKIQVFTSLEDEKRFEASKQTQLSYRERLSNLEVLRKMLYKEHLLPDGTWKTLVKKITIVNP
ncbi:MAG: hypothetical protein HYU67_03905 [Flavobacteriia bacterium]|nr:hypothetical protein [Flavobacteriia bacterium]